MLRKIISIIVLLVLILSSNVYATEKKESIIDNANIIKNKEIVQATLNNFKISQEIDVFIYTTQKATQEDFENTMNKYKSLYPNNMILLYFSVENYNVGIFVSDDLKAIVTDANKTVALKSMESFIALEKYDEAINTAIKNLDVILKETRKEINHEILDVENIEDKTTQRMLSLGGMGISALCILIMFIFLVKDIHKGIKEKKEQELIDKLRKEGKI